MPRRDRAGDRAPDPRTARLIASIRGGVPARDPRPASWDDPDSPLPPFGYYNFHTERHEYGRGRIPKDLLWMYLPEAREQKQHEPN